MLNNLSKKVSGKTKTVNTVSHLLPQHTFDKKGSQAGICYFGHLLSAHPSHRNHRRQKQQQQTNHASHYKSQKITKISSSWLLAKEDFTKHQSMDSQILLLRVQSCKQWFPQGTETEDIFSAEREESQGSHSIHSQSKCQMWQPNQTDPMSIPAVSSVAQHLGPVSVSFPSLQHFSREKGYLLLTQSWRFSQCSGGPTALGLWCTSW